jgi:hypothetical protein
MTDADRKELIRIIELDYEQTTKLIEGVVGTSFTIRGWGITLVAALIGLTFQTGLWQMAALAGVATLLIGLMDGYHSWIYTKILRHAQNIERVLGLYYASLARGDDDPDAHIDFEVALLAHRFGRFAEFRKFGLKTLLRDARPRMVLVMLYLTLLICSAACGILVLRSKQTNASKFQCTSVSGTKNVYLCQPQ